ncbi:pre-mRNA-processing factor 39 isoform X2 [Bacillus rossius redtenbacheri]|uniref:pre-mRNA-processing factor 39 isoform X2 n=1 Tax=Bacillus rossius redtenbacheri TaxID=93214 RepID=UPI002FDC9B4F
MASVEDVDVNLQESAPVRRSKNVAKRGRSKKRGAATVSTRATRSKKVLSSSMDSEEEEEAEETSQNDVEAQDDQEVGRDLDSSDESKNTVVENDVIKNGVEETASPEIKTKPKEIKSESGLTEEDDAEVTTKSRGETGPEVDLANVESETKVKVEADKTISASNETECVKAESTVESEVPKSDAKIASNDDEADEGVVVEKDKKAAEKTAEKSIVKEEKTAAVYVIPIEDDVAMIKEGVSTSDENAASTKVTVTVKDESATVEDKPITVEDKSATVEDKPITVEDKSATVEDKPITVEDKSVILEDEAVPGENKSADNKSVSAEDKTAITKAKNKSAAERKMTDADDTGDVTMIGKEKVSPLVPSKKKQVSSEGGSSEKQNGAKPVDSSSAGSPMDVDGSQSAETPAGGRKEREQSPEAGDMKNASMDDMTVIDEVDDEGDEKEEGGKAGDKTHTQLDDTEMVSEDELPTETAKEPETEAVSDEELPEPAASGDLPETEEVSEDELPPEKTEKKKKDSKPAAPVEPDKASEQAKKKRKSRFEAQKRKLAEGDTYDPSSPTSENSCDETPSAKRAALSSGSTDGKVKQSVKGRKTLPELEKYWKAVKEDASDFTGWTYLLQYVDQENDIDAAREAYDAFLSHYPYCYGYWRKYADYEKRKGNKEKCEEVFDRGLKAIPLSVDLWIHYLHYCKTAFADDEEFLRAQFERALTACGMEFRSDRLWESYIKWETEGKRLQNVTAIYDRLLNMPTQGYTSHFENFQEHVSSNAPQKVLSVDEFLSLRREVLQLLKQYDSPKAEEAAPGEEVEAPPGEEPEEMPSVSDEETTALRERIVSLRRKVHKATVAAVADRWNFEEGIKRPYFHVKPLERCQLKNWKEYLDFEIEKGDKERIVILFERCLIACALYEEFWLKFVRYLENEKDEDMVDKIRDVYERACTIHHPKKPNLHLHWSVFEESHKNFDKAAEILTNLEKAVPNLVQVSYRRINLERRRGNLDKVCSLYEHYINGSKNKVIANNMAIKYARFCWKQYGERARGKHSTLQFGHRGEGRR